MPSAPASRSAGWGQRLLGDVRRGVPLQQLSPSRRGCRRHPPYALNVSNLRLLRIIQVICLPVWLVSALAVFLGDGPIRWVWLSMWTVAMIVFFVALWRSLWLASGPGRPRERRGSS